jgi:hypothetical protein
MSNKSQEIPARSLRASLEQPCHSRRGRDSLAVMMRWLVMIKWLVLMALLAGCATQQAAQTDCKMKWTGQPPVQVDSCTGRSEDLTPDWHWYDYVFSIPLGIVGFYDPARNGA